MQRGGKILCRHQTLINNAPHSFLCLGGSGCIFFFHRRSPNREKPKMASEREQGAPTDTALITSQIVFWEFPVWTTHASCGKGRPRDVEFTLRHVHQKEFALGHEGVGVDGFFFFFEKSGGRWLGLGRRLLWFFRLNIFSCLGAEKKNEWPRWKGPNQKKR